MLEKQSTNTISSQENSLQQTLLLVDDEVSIRNSLKRLLRKEGYKVLTAASGREGLEILKSQNINVILSDERMPHMPGHEFLTAAQEISPQTTRMILSGYADFDAISKAVNEAEIYRFLVKPWDDKQLINEIRGAFKHQESFATLMDHLPTNQLASNNNIQLINQTSHCITSRQLDALEVDLHDAIRTNSLDICYQPQLHLSSGKIVGCEALSRWNHPTRGAISPASFIPMAEQSGLACALDRHMIKMASQAIVEINAHRAEPIRISINITANHLLLKQLSTEIKAIVNELGVFPNHLELEITERQLLHDFKFCRGIFCELMDLGVRISLDDFGTGYSSIRYLDNLPVDAIKIDRSFITDLPNNKRHREIVKTLIDLAHNLGIEVVGEGVETNDEFQFLQENGCDVIQGYWFSKPLNFEQFNSIIGNHTSN